MKITFDCPACGTQEKISVLAVGWKKIHHRCSHCGVTAVHQYKQIPAAGLIALGGFASWGIALLGRMAFGLSLDVTLLVMLGSVFILAFFFMGKLVDACSTWRLQGEEAGKPKTT